MDMEKLAELIGKAGKGQRVDSGQKTLGYLKDVLSLLPADMPCRFDTGHNFGREPVVFTEEEAFSVEGYSQPAYMVADSETAYPSCYRGYYRDATFNASRDYCISNVGHVLGLVESAIGKPFGGYKGGVYDFHEGTLVWGGSSSFSGTSGEMVVGIRIRDGECLILTRIEQEWSLFTESKK